MKNAIIIYSKTGNTRSVAKKLSENLNCELLEVAAVNDDPNILVPELTNKPDTTNYEYIVFASPVHGFSLAKIMEAYLKQLPSLEGKTIDLFITHYFPFAWMGGNRALKQMELIVKAKQASVGKKVSVNWTSKKRDSIITNLIKDFSID